MDLPVGLAAILYTGWACRRRLNTTSPVMALQALTSCTDEMVNKRHTQYVLRLESVILIPFTDRFRINTRLAEVLLKCEMTIHEYTRRSIKIEV